MPWLNWSLKLHNRLRTISLLISTHNTQVYVQWMPYSFVWLYLLKCFFTCSIFVDSNIKRVLSVLGAFGKYFVFTKNWKISKTVLLCFGNSVAGHPSCMLQLRARALILVTFSWVKGPIARGTQRFSRLSSRLPRGLTFQSQKTLRNFFYIFVFECFGGLPWRLVGDSLQSRKTRVLRFKDNFFEFFLVFPLNFCDCSLSSPFLSQLNLTQTLRVTLLKLHFCIIPSPIFKKKVWVFSVSLDSSCFENNFFFWVVTVVWDVLCSNMFLLRLMGIYLSGVFIVCFLVVICWSTLYCDNIRSLMTHKHSLSFSGHSH